MDPMRRALYLLEIFGNPLLEGDQPVLDPDFLMDIMEFNEEVDEVISKEDIADLRDKIRTELERLHNELKEEFSQQNTGSAKIVVAKMQYYHNLRYKVKDKELELGIVD
jgi:Fe-S protein assembly co-chaperone HscB